MLQRLQQVLTAKFPKWITGTYGDGYIEYFTYNSLGQGSEYYYDIKDANGKTVRSVPTAYSYDLSGTVALENMPMELVAYFADGVHPTGDAQIL